MNGESFNSALKNEHSRNWPSNLHLIKITPQYETRNSSNFIKNLNNYFSQYCASTTIHGFKYIRERGRFLPEKLTWAVVLLVVGTLCTYLILQTYIKLLTAPVLISLSTTETPIWHIPFPAVTICPEVKSDPAVFNITQALVQAVLYNPDYEKKHLMLLTSLCNNFVNFMDPGNRKQFVDETIYFDLLEIMPKFDPLNITTITWAGNQLPVDDVLSISVTSSGLCYTFNMLDYEEILSDLTFSLNKSYKNSKPQRWSIEEGFVDDNPLDSIPRRSFVSGMEGGLTIDKLFTNHSHLAYLCGESLQGFQVALHHPSELPNMDKHFRIPLDEAVLVAIKPKMITVAKHLLHYKPEIRNCFFSHERKLVLFKSYTQHNCFIECLSNYTISQCQCVPFYMPGLPGSQICGYGNEKCIEESRVNYMLLDEDLEDDCNCLPSCTNLEYDVEIIQSKWNWKDFVETMINIGFPEYYTEYLSGHLSRLTVYYKDIQFLTMQRHEMYGYIDFFSNIGGLLGLFWGFSVISIIEILYFMTFRVICNIKKYGKSRWSGEN